MRQNNVCFLPGNCHMCLSPFLTENPTELIKKIKGRGMKVCEPGGVVWCSCCVVYNDTQMGGGGGGGGK